MPPYLGPSPHLITLMYTSNYPQTHRFPRLQFIQKFICKNPRPKDTRQAVSLL